jgi:hypothetical protein
MSNSNYYKRIPGSNIQGDATTVTEPYGTLVLTNNNELRLHDGTTQGGVAVSGSGGGFATTSTLVNGTYTVALSTTGQLNLPSAANNESSNARIQSANSIDILSNLSKWTFGTDGALTVPGEIKSAANTGPVIVNSNDGDNTYTWTFGSDGTFNLPTFTGSPSIAIIQSTSSISLNANGQAWTYGINGNLYLPQGSVLGETTTTTVISPPGAATGQSLVIRPTSGQVAITTDHLSGFVPGETITITVTTNAGPDSGTLDYVITGATSQQLGRATSGTLIYTSESVKTVTWTVPAQSSMTTFTFDLNGGSGFVNNGGLYIEGLPEITVTLDSSAVSENNHIHLIAGDPATVDLYLGDDDQYVKIEKNGGDVVIGTNTNTNHWSFGTDGSLTFPDSTVQSSAYPGVLVPANGDNVSGVANLVFYAGPDWYNTSKVGINPATGFLTLSGTGGAGGIILPNSGVIDVGSQFGTTLGLTRKIYSEYLGGYGISNPTYSELVTALAGWTPDSISTTMPEAWAGIPLQTWEFTGYFRAPATGTYVFEASVDDYYFIVIDGDINPTPEMNAPAVVVLAQGQIVSYRVMYANVAGGGTLTLSWRNDTSQIPATNDFTGLLCTDLGTTVDITVNNNKTWVFGEDGTLTAPGNINVGITGTSSAVNIQGLGAGNVIGYQTLLSVVTDNNHPYAITVQNATAGLDKGLGIYVQNDGDIILETVNTTSSIVIWTDDDKQWTFGANGSLTFPDATVQTTAYRVMLLPPLTAWGTVVSFDNLSFSFDATTGSPGFNGGYGQGNGSYSTLIWTADLYQQLASPTNLTISSGGPVQYFNYNGPNLITEVALTPGDSFVLRIQDVDTNRVYRATFLASFKAADAGNEGKYGAITVERLV